MRVEWPCNVALYYVGSPSWETIILRVWRLLCCFGHEGLWSSCAPCQIRRFADVWSHPVQAGTNTFGGTRGTLSFIRFFLFALLYSISEVYGTQTIPGRLWMVLRVSYSFLCSNKKRRDFQQALKWLLKREKYLWTSTERSTVRLVADLKSRRFYRVHHFRRYF